MTDDELTLAIRDMYRRAVTTHQSDDLAIRACMTVLRAQHLRIAEADARSMIAKMLAEEPLGSPHEPR
jgi:hypothetical protein